MPVLHGYDYENRCATTFELQKGRCVVKTKGLFCGAGATPGKARDDAAARLQRYINWLMDLDIKEINEMVRYDKDAKAVVASAVLAETPSVDNQD